MPQFARPRHHHDSTCLCGVEWYWSYCRDQRKGETFILIYAQNLPFHQMEKLDLVISGSLGADLVAAYSIPLQ